MNINYVLTAWYFITKFSIFIQYVFEFTYFVNLGYINDGEASDHNGSDRLEKTLPRKMFPTACTVSHQN